MDKASLKQRANLLYRLRRKGVACDTGLRLIFIPYESDPYEKKEVIKLCKDFHFNIQYVIT